MKHGVKNGIAAALLLTSLAMPKLFAQKPISEGILLKPAIVNAEGAPSQTPANAPKQELAKTLLDSIDCEVLKVFENHNYNYSSWIVANMKKLSSMGYGRIFIELAPSDSASACKTAEFMSSGKMEQSLKGSLISASLRFKAKAGNFSSLDSMQLVNLYQAAYNNGWEIVPMHYYTNPSFCKDSASLSFSSEAEYVALTNSFYSNIVKERMVDGKKSVLLIGRKHYEIDIPNSASLYIVSKDEASEMRPISSSMMNASEGRMNLALKLSKLDARACASIYSSSSWEWKYYSKIELELYAISASSTAGLFKALIGSEPAYILILHNWAKERN
jgi:hypothetical protein